MSARRRLKGIVTSDKMLKTVVIKISRSYRHPIYKKVIHTSKKVMAHDELGCKIGDTVQIVGSKPISRKKRWVGEKKLNSIKEPAE